jgi:spore maturation protein CgeB
VATVRKAGYKNIHFLPQCTDPDVHRPIKIKDEKNNGFQAEITLIGSMYPYRLELISQLKDFRPKIWGKGWQKAHDPAVRDLYMGLDIRGDNKAMVISNSKISLNPHHPLNDIFGVNRRTYDIAGCGGFQIADLKADMHHSYKIDDEIICYGALEELREKLNYYLKRPEETRIIAEKAYNKTIKCHTYLHRATEILDYVKNYR